MEAGSDASRTTPPPSPPVRLVERLADRLGSTAHSTAVFGEPIERGSVTVIPVAKARWGFGGGGGRSLAHAGERPGEHPTGPEGEGPGGGGGVAVVPVGFIEVRDGGARFHRIVDEGAIVALAAMALVASVIGWRIVARLSP